MITAAQAKEKTKERITQVAKEFIINEVDTAVETAISFGRFSCTVNLKGLVSQKVTGVEIASQLQELGFDAEYVSNPFDSEGSEGYIDIKWED